jgi:4-alpha-glucanotransferase
LPNNFVSNAVAYTGTHDNATTREWYEESPDYQRQNFWNYLKRAPGAEEDACPLLVDLAWKSSAALALAPLQDLLNLGAESRMNTPGRASGNWRWRCSGDLAADQAFRWLRNLTDTSQRMDPGMLAQTALENSNATVGEAQ